MKIYTFYSKLTDASDVGENELISVWKASWKKNGWTPIVLGFDSIIADSGYIDFYRHILSLPTYNKRQYTLSTFTRWYAVMKQGGGVMCDYDVINYGYKPSGLCMDNVISLETDYSCPCFVYGNRVAYENMIHLFLSYRPSDAVIVHGKPHLSDQTIMLDYYVKNKRQDIFRMPKHSRLAQYGQKRWVDADLVHYATSSTQMKVITIHKERPVRLT